MNIIDLLYELEPLAFQKVIMKPLLEEFIGYFNTQFQNRPSLSSDALEERISATFVCNHCIIKVHNTANFDQVRKQFFSALGKEETTGIFAILHHGTPSYYTFIKLTLKKEITEILRKKREDLFVANDKQYGRELNEKFLDNFAFDHPYIINDELSQPFNDEQYFKKVNYTLIYRSTVDRNSAVINSRLDLEKCKARLAAINKQISDSETVDLFAHI